MDHNRPTRSAERTDVRDRDRFGRFHHRHALGDERRRASVYLNARPNSAVFQANAEGPERRRVEPRPNSIPPGRAFLRGDQPERLELVQPWIASGDSHFAPLAQFRRGHWFAGCRKANLQRFVMHNRVDEFQMIPSEAPTVFTSRGFTNHGRLREHTSVTNGFRARLRCARGDPAPCGVSDPAGHVRDGVLRLAGIGITFAAYCIV